MERKFLISPNKKQQEIKEIVIYDHPEKLKPLLNRLTWKILLMLSDKEMYPMEIAKKLKIHEQKIYYHIRKLAKVNAIEKVKEEERKGAIAKYYKTSFPAFGVELPFGAQKHKITQPSFIDKRINQFLKPLLKDGIFQGKVIVGSPDPHGPFKTSARDGHYASYLTFFLGQYSKLPEDFAIKLDVDIKVEKEEKNNLILVGGPGTNLFTQDVNEYLPIKFNMTPSKHGFLFSGLVSKETNRVYIADTIGLIAKIVNPWDREKIILVFAGNKAVGTKACILAFAKFGMKVLKNYKGEDKFAVVIQGFDLDGDGKVDSIEVIDTYIQ
ncbi:MAG: helix-turn-helix domain-containing protein [Candidatus Bathyarchaeota archaeon]|nr:MAG: helix-turn-helix domain-containing protein [Candidatus Bathyarchaeota archaeon]